MEIEFDVKMTQKEMYDFLMNHTYRSLSGIVGVLFGVLAFVVFFVTFGKTSQTQSILYLVFGLWFLAYLPVNLYIRAGKQVKLNPTFKKPLTYRINAEGVTTMQDEKQILIEWKDILKIRETRVSLLVYTGMKYSFVLPKASMGSQYEAVTAMLRTHVDEKKMNIRKR